MHTTFQKESLKRAWAEISLARLKNNVEKCRSLLSPENAFMCVVKANCYGHGVLHTVPFLEQECGIDWFGVSNLAEAIELREIGISGEILILGWTPLEHAPRLVEYDIIQAVTDLEYAKALCASAPSGEKIRCHIAIDTGMTRIGLRGENTASDAEKIFRMPSLSCEGIFTHLSCADSDAPEDIEYTNAQINKIISLKNELNRRLIIVPEIHFLNSAGCAYHPDARSSLARFGIMLFGLHPNSHLPLPVSLEPVMELKATVSQVKTVEAGVDISYGRTYTTQRETRVAVVTIGYADGYPRLLSGKAEVLIKGHRAKVVGRICMDQLMIDVTDIPNVRPQDVVTLFGRDGNEEITADDLADLIGTIGYEIVCGLSPRVPRITI